MTESDSKFCVSRRTVLLAAAGAAPMLVVSTGGANAAPSMSPTAVGYQDSPKDGRQCEGCNLFVAPNACKTVKGEISPKGWCRIWVKKAA